LDVDGLSDPGIEIGRQTNFIKEAGTSETSVVGYAELRRRSAPGCYGPDRSATRIVFVDAVEPKKDLTRAETLTHPFPNMIHVEYSLRPDFIPSVEPGAATKQRRCES